MVIEHIFDTIKLISNKSRRGSLKTSQIRIAVKSAMLDFFKDELEIYRTSGVIPASIKKFSKTTAVPVVSGEGALPSDFTKEITFKTDCGSEGDFVSAEAFQDRLKSFIIPPSEEFPVAKIEDSKIIVAPDETDSVNLTYFRVPADFVYAVTVDGDGRGSVFDSGGSTDVEFSLDFSGPIIKKALIVLGVAIQNKDAAQFGLTE